ncbi:Outer membrane protein OmpA [Aquimarina amphilecti]|uniref:Outer membrane protein OmpA n=1 Tax=Aquimarina amphilecti TaxID=1038014 RepID=A0A1H7H5I9_AQUAM|nr:OmpA family protein [Aquimarina amphilecti]SEK44260.1 Outer membrane protein OmpA [Aquimarina amphilecti]
MKSHKIKNSKKLIYVGVLLITLMSCKSMKNSELGGFIGATGGAIIGGVIGNNTGGDTELGAVIGGIVGATVGSVIGNQMDQQAKKIEEELPTVVVERVEEDINIVFDEESGVYFKTNKHELNESSKETINKLAEVLKEYPNSDILIEGHTDNVGKEESNFVLSKYRAQSVKNYLVELGVEEQRFTVAYYGESQPKYTNDTSDGKSKNRRVEVTISPNEALRKQAVAQIKE